MLLRLRYIYRFRFHLEYAEAWFVYRIECTPSHLRLSSLVYIQNSSRVDLAGISTCVALRPEPLCPTSLPHVLDMSLDIAVGERVSTLVTRAVA